MHPVLPVPFPLLLLLLLLPIELLLSVCPLIVGLHYIVYILEGEVSQMWLRVCVAPLRRIGANQLAMQSPPYFIIINHQATKYYGNRARGDSNEMPARRFHRIGFSSGNKKIINIVRFFFNSMKCKFSERNKTMWRRKNIMGTELGEVLTRCQLDDFIEQDCHKYRTRSFFFSKFGEKKQENCQSSRKETKLCRKENILWKQSQGRF